MTGPFFVTGAEPGDTLTVSIDRMTMTRETGWTFTPIAPNVVDPGAGAAMPERTRHIWTIDSDAGRAWLAEPPEALREWSVPLAPMIGCFGVAPARGAGDLDRDQRAARRQHGLPALRGGHDCALPRGGAGRAVLPRRLPRLPGRRRDRGDGDRDRVRGEFAARVAKGRTIGWPRGETEDAIFTVGNARPLDQALQHATTEMLAWLASDYGLDAAAESVFGQVVRYDVANVFNPAYSVACRVEKRWLR